MSQIQIKIYPLNDSNQEVQYELDLMSELDIAVTYAIDDIEDITKRKASFSKTITLPNTQENAVAFKFAYNIQSFAGGFTPNKKIRCVVMQDGMEIFQGVLQLLSVSKIGNDVKYECSIFSEEIDFYQTINDKLLSDLSGLTAMNHAPTSAIVENSWTSGHLSGYVYGLVDNYGANDVLQQNITMRVPWYKFTPSVYVKHLIDLIFKESGYTYESTFFNTTFFKSLVVPYSLDKAGTPTTGFNSYVGATGTITIPNYPSQVCVSGTINQKKRIPFNVDNSGVFYDSSGYWVASSNVFVTPNNGVNSIWDFSAKITPLFRNNSTMANMYFAIQKVIGATQTNPIVANTLYPRTMQFDTPFYVNWTQITLEPNSIYEFVVGFQPTQNPAATCGLGGLIVGGVPDTSLVIKGVEVFDQYDFKKVVPKDTKQVDLIQDLQKMFNLYITQDRQNSRKLYIEPWKDYYDTATNALDWTTKIDEGAEQTITNGLSNNIKNVIFKYRQTNDYLHKSYKQLYPTDESGYGGIDADLGNYYGKTSRITELKCATIIPATFQGAIPVARTWDYDGSAVSANIKPLECGYRLAQYNFITTTQFEYQHNPTDYLVKNLPFISHTNRPLDPTIDLAFGMPKRIFYNAPNVSGNILYTNNNLYNVYWKTYIEEIMSTDAMTLTAYALLTPRDINNLNFNKLIFYKGMLFRLLSIEDYVLGKQKTAKITLRRVLGLANFIPTSLIPVTNDPPALKVSSSANAIKEYNPVLGGKVIPITQGLVGSTWEGTYNPTTLYAPTDIVQINGQSFIAKDYVYGVTPTTLATDYWTLVAAKGSDGANGADGVSGSDGAISGRWIYDSTYNSNPSQTYFQSDDPNWSNIGKFYLNDTEYETASSFIAYFQIMQLYLGIPVDVYLEIQCVSTNALKEHKALYLVYGVTDVGGVWEIVVGMQQKNGSPQANKVHAFKFLAMGISTWA